MGKTSRPDWLLDTSLPLVIEGPEWRAKAAQVEALPRWFYKPAPEVQAFFESIDRDEKPLPNAALAKMVIDHVSRDLIAFLWYFTSVRDRDTRRRVRPKWTPGQLVFAWRTMQLVHEDKPVRLDLLKTRQSGNSTLISNILYWIVGFRPNIGGLQAAQDKDTTRQIHSYVKEVFEHQPEWMRPAKRYSSRLELLLEEPKEEERLAGNRGLESSIAAQTAGKDFLGTGQPIQVLQASEVGKWHKACDPATTYTSVANAIQDLPWTFIFRESTAHGAETYWHVEWRDALKMGRPGWSGFTPIFIPWYFDPRNRAKAPPGMELGTEDKHEFGNEVALKKLYDLDDDQLEWRRATIRKQPNTGRRKTDLFAQEHPGTQAEAWLHAHGRFVDVETLQLLRARSHKLDAFVWQGEMNHRRERGRDFSFKGWGVKRALGPLTIWEKPDPRFDYVIGADVAEGLADGDFSCAQVYKRFPSHLDLVAEWWGHAPTDIFAMNLWRLGWFYSTNVDGDKDVPALLAWERTGPGGNIHAWLKNGNVLDPTDAYPPHRQYRAVRVDRKKQVREPVFGVATSRWSKRPMLDTWVEWAREGNVLVHRPTVDEAESLEHDERGGIETGGKDRFMASVIAVWAHKTYPLLRITDPKESEEPAWGSVAWADKLEAEAREKSLNGEDLYEERLW